MAKIGQIWPKIYLEWTGIANIHLLVTQMIPIHPEKHFLIEKFDLTYISGLFSQGLDGSMHI